MNCPFQTDFLSDNPPLLFVGQERARHWPAVESYGDLGEPLKLRVSDRIDATIVRQFTLRENEISTLNRITIREPVTDENRRRVGRIHETHHGWFTGGATVTAGLFEERKLRPPGTRI